MTVEQEAFLEKLYRENFPRLLGYATAVLENKSLAMDVVQDTFHTAVAKIHILMSHSNPNGWLMETLKHKIRDQIRAYRRYTARFVSFEDFEPYMASPDTNTAEIWESIPAIWKKVEQVLTPEDFHLLKRIVLDGYSHREVAEELHISIWASQKRLQRIRLALMDIFPEHAHKKEKIFSKKIRKTLSVFLLCGNMITGRGV